ncbi:MAG TPA: diguanylate cyclase [Candidatus Sulfotelmatobacter sp.]|jgi:diguanylate cyclase (GGDEF)-like protein
MSTSAFAVSDSTIAGNTAFTVLVAEDSPVYRLLIKDQFRKWGFNLVLANDGQEAWRILSGRDAPKLALLDWVLPKIDGIEICRRLRGRMEQGQYTYAILLTAKSKKDEMLEAMDAGADDFLAKPFDPLELKARLLVGKRIIELQKRLVLANQSLEFAACHDYLTGLWNRAEIRAFLHQELARARRDRTHVGIVLADIDHFKKVNDTLGHEVGDVVLKNIATCLRESLREYDKVGRYGGEEFLLVIPGCDLLNTARRANQIRENVAQLPIRVANRTMTVTISMGATVAESSNDLEELVRRADTALYRAKRNGKNRLECADVDGISFARDEALAQP